MSLMVAQRVPTSTIMALPHGPTGVADARRRLRSDLGAQGVPESVMDDAVLIVSELISNSCRHARPLGEALAERVGDGAGRFPADARGAADPLPGGIRAAWSVGQDGLLVLEVTDGGGPTRPRPASPSLTARGGRGLGIVESLALRWGVRDAPGEVTVWAVLPVRGRHARRDGSPGTGLGLPLGVPIGLPLDLAESLDDLA
ncbi:ATP-binding protein [Actinacidiphila yeochonensis]|uniref:ATP-binding protein n=1 Tax=Actinacidiphila yeochonensis TaxID=89050 RepID=UPI00055C655C|nr:ATP-binding protein [Actinacidiphila yeochonensis]